MQRRYLWSLNTNIVNHSSDDNEPRLLTLLPSKRRVGSGCWKALCCWTKIWRLQSTPRALLFQRLLRWMLLVIRPILTICPIQPFMNVSISNINEHVDIYLFYRWWRRFIPSPFCLVLQTKTEQGVSWISKNGECLSSPVNPGIGKCGRVCGDCVWRQNPPGNNMTNFTKSHDFNLTCPAK